jgi:hypothetical protein
MTHGGIVVRVVTRASPPVLAAKMSTSVRIAKVFSDYIASTAETAVLRAGLKPRRQRLTLDSVYLK